jgi:hypothetical protein
MSNCKPILACASKKYKHKLVVITFYASAWPTNIDGNWPGVLSNIVGGIKIWI